MKKTQIKSSAFIDMKHLNVFPIVGSKKSYQDQVEKLQNRENPIKNNRVDLDRKCETLLAEMKKMNRKWSFQATCKNKEKPAKQKKHVRIVWSKYK